MSLYIKKIYILTLPIFEVTKGEVTVMFLYEVLKNISVVTSNWLPLMFIIIQTMTGIEVRWVFICE